VNRGDDLRGRWLWLFPASYAIHIAEEGLAGERFYRWIARLTGREISGRAFTVGNLALEAGMTAAVRVAAAREEAAWVVPMLGTITAMNGTGHLVGSVVTQSYSPGAVSGLGLWAPLGLFALIRSRRVLPGRLWRRGVLAGVALQGGAMLLALGLSRPAAGDR
jgi:hypothetical protein